MDDLREKFPKLEEWEAESESAQPTLRQLENFARRTRTPLGYLFLDQPPDETLPIPQFRTVQTVTQSRPSPDLIETIQMMQRRQAWLRENLISEHEDRVPFVGTAALTDPPQSVAARIRYALGLATGWARAKGTWEKALRALREAIDGVGVIVSANGVVGNNNHRKLDVEEFRGFVLVDEYAPLVFVNASDSKGAQMFTLAHELAHLWFGESAVFDLQRLQPAPEQIERVCNAVAAEFLVPQAELRAEWDAVRSDQERFDKLARIFKVSSIVAARRALDLELITQDAFFAFYRDYQAAEHEAHSSDEGGNFYATQNVRLGRRFSVAIVNAAREGRVTYREAYELTGLWGQTFDKYASKLEIGGQE
ncbi:MAG TPA: ImmA/IrrE family metallo-endopeptidase [Vicinamibacterales bacterium]|nr:ImmA/IrrE family metallo-endopeptidase [Vicinamibacterales bacterium]